jgi:bifunctional hydroxylase/dehydrase
MPVELPHPEVPVIVVGAGPTGLMLAGELRLAGCDVLVVERLERPTSESRGLGFTARAAEVFTQRGLHHRFSSMNGVAAGHFGGLPLDYTVLPDCDFGVRDVEQSETEAVLAAWALELGAQVLRGRTVTGVVQDDDGVDLEVQGPDGAERLRCAYLVGADGGRSTVRRLAGFTFAGHDATCEMILADVVGCDIAPRPLGERGPQGMVMSAPLSDGATRIIVCERGRTPGERSGPPPFDEVAAAWQRLTGTDISHGHGRWISSFTDAARQATEYRRGRVLLCGDAAHIHLPAGGQGLSVGVQDAVNLGWKLGAVASGRMPDALLDTYHTERHPVGERVLMNTGAQGLLNLGGSEVEPLRSLMGELMTIPEVARHLAGTVSGTDVRYDLDGGGHPLVGSRLPDAALVVDGATTTGFGLLHDARGVLIDLTGDPAVERAARPWRRHVDVVRARVLSDHLQGADALLVRPDGHVAWVSPGSTSLPTALRTWFGVPVPSPAATSTR